MTQPNPTTGTTTPKEAQDLLFEQTKYKVKQNNYILEKIKLYGVD